MKNNPGKIILAFPQYETASNGSMTEYFVLLKQELTALGLTVLEGIPENYGGLLNLFLKKNARMEMLAVRLVGLLGGWLPMYWAFLAFLPNGCDDFHIVAISQEYAPYCHKRKSIVIAHDMIQLKFPRSRLTYLFYKFFVLWSLRHCQKVITVSNYSKKLLAHECVESEVVYNFFDFHRLAFALRKLNVVRNKKQILWIGTDAAHKSIETLLEAAKQLEDYRFIAVLPKINDSLHGKITHNVSLRSRVSPEDLVVLYSSSNIFVSSSLEEGYGRPAMEARYFGCGLVLSDIPIYRELHSNYAFFFTPGNVKSLIEKIVLITVMDGGLDTEFDWSRVAERDQLAKKINEYIVVTAN